MNLVSLVRKWAIRGMVLVVAALAGRKISSAWRALVSPEGGKRGGPDDIHGAGVPARLKPPPPVLAGAAAKALPVDGEQEAA